MKTLLQLFAILFILYSTNANSQSYDAQLSVFPQPASTQLSLSFDTEQQNPVHVMVYDLLGNLIAETNLIRDEKGTYTMYVGDKKPGYYFLKIITDDITFSRRITIKP